MIILDNEFNPLKIVKSPYCRDDFQVNHIYNNGVICAVRYGCALFDIREAREIWESRKEVKTLKELHKMPIYKKEFVERVQRTLFIVIQQDLEYLAESLEWERENLGGDGA